MVELCASIQLIIIKQPSDSFLEKSSQPDRKSKKIQSELKYDVVITKRF